MSESTDHGLLPAGTYILIWFALLALTGLTVTAVTMQLGGMSVFTAIAIALVKASLVVFFFMNLKQEPRVFKLMLGVALFTLTVILVLTFVDILFR